MVTLENIKRNLNIDFADNDDYLQSLLYSAELKAWGIIGEQTDTPEVDNAIMEDVASMYQSRGEKQTGSESSLYTYRRLSKRPML